MTDLRIGTVSAVAASTGVPSIVDDQDSSGTAFGVDAWLPSNGPVVNDRILYSITQGYVVVHASLTRTPQAIATKNLTITGSGWAAAGAGAFASVVGGMVLVWGSMSNSTFSSTAFTTVGTLPAGIPNPPIGSSAVAAPVGGSATGVARSIQVTAAGAVQMRTDSATAAAYSFNLSYPAV